MSNAKKLPPMSTFFLLVSVICLQPQHSHAQGTAADYERANSLKSKYEAAVIDIAGPATWIGNTNRFWYRKLSKGVNEYIIVDAQSLTKQPAFDHTKIAATLSKVLGSAY